MKSTIHILLSMITAVTLIACSSPPKLEAELQITNYIERAPLTARMNQELDGLSVNESITVSKVEYILSQRYVSALGEKCMKLASYNEGKVITYCKDASTWYELPPLMTTHTEGQS